MLTPTISTNEIYFDEDTSKVLTSKLNQFTTQLTNITETRAHVDHTHAAYENSVQTKNKVLQPTLSNGTFSIVDEGEVYKNNGRYIVSIKYTNGNALVDQSLYLFTFTRSSRLCPTFNLVKCNSSSDTLLATQTDGVVTFAAQYNGTGSTGCTITLI